MAGLFVWAAVLQINDPDGALWIGLYGFLAFLSVYAVFRTVSRRGWQMAVIIYSVALLVVLTSVDEWAMSSERAREAGGLLLALGWLLTLKPRRT